MEAICSRVTLPSGSKPAPVPLTISVWLAQSTASVYHASGFTSGKPDVPAAAGSPSSRHSAVTSMARVMVPLGEKVVALVPLKSSFV